MSIAKSLRTASRKVQRQHIVEGYPVDPRSIEGFAYRGTSLGLPGFVAKDMKDPLVALSPDSSDGLIGVSYAVVGGLCLETPTSFTLEREGPIDYVPPAVG